MPWFGFPPTLFFHLSLFLLPFPWPCCSPRPYSRLISFQFCIHFLPQGTVACRYLQQRLFGVSCLTVPLQRWPITAACLLALSLRGVPVAVNCAVLDKPPFLPACLPTREDWEVQTVRTHTHPSPPICTQAHLTQRQQSPPAPPARS
ncbi:hypothetical protein LY78DRAFT_336058 [Colletotrichum sublineola]|nr:hypothetical protein LY78DRAFT_336058 [Colletotrichum sublineola]